MHIQSCRSFYSCNLLLDFLHPEQLFKLQLRCEYLVGLFVGIFLLKKRLLLISIVVAIVLAVALSKHYKRKFKSVCKFWNIKARLKYINDLFRQIEEFFKLIERWIKLPVEIRVARSLTASLYTVYLYYITPTGNHICTAQISVRKDYFSQSDREIYLSLAALIAIFDYSWRNIVGYFLRFFPEFLLLFLSFSLPSYCLVISLILCISKLWLMQRIVYRLFYLYSLIATQNEIQNISTPPYIRNIFENLKVAAKDPSVVNNLFTNLLVWKAIFPIFGG